MKTASRFVALTAHYQLYLVHHQARIIAIAFALWQGVSRLLAPAVSAPLDFLTNNQYAILLIATGLAAIVTAPSCRRLRFGGRLSAALLASVYLLTGIDAISNAAWTSGGPAIILGIALIVFDVCATEC